MFDVTCACIGMKDLGVVVASSPTTIEIASDWDRNRTIVASYMVCRVLHSVFNCISSSRHLFRPVLKNKCSVQLVWKAVILLVNKQLYRQ